VHRPVVSGGRAADQLRAGAPFGIARTRPAVALGSGVVQPGEHIGRYRIEAVLGRGGMGEVFRAWAETLQRRVAIKVLRAFDEPASADGSGGSSASSVRRLVREARMAAALRHPNVVAIFDVGEQDGCAYIVMEYLRGDSLRAFIGAQAKGEATTEDRVRWLVAVASALAAAHRQGLVHRDVKPDNVLVDEHLAVKVLDFGIARRDEASSRDPAAARDRPSAAPPSAREGDAAAAITQGATVEEGRVIGTPGYMAPEQILGQPIDGRADQFAWGVTAYELLTGRWPWPDVEGTNSLLATTLAHAPMPLDPVALGVAPAVTSAIQRALSRSRDDRFATMDALLAALGQPVERARSLAPPPLGGPAERPFASLESAPTVLAGAITGAAPPPAKSAATATRPRRKLLLGALALALVASATLGARQLRARGARGVGAILGGARAAAAPSTRSSGSSAGPYATLRPRNVRRLTMEYGCQEFASITPDGATVLYDGTAGRDLHVFAIDVDGGKPRALTEGAGWQWAASVAPDGREFAYLRTENDVTAAYASPLDGAPGVRATRKLADGSVRPRYTPDGRALWAGSQRTPRRLDRQTGQITRTLTAPSGFRAIEIVELEGGRTLMHLAPGEGYDAAGIVSYEPGAGEAATPTWLTHDGIDEALLLLPDERSLLAPKMSHALRGQLFRYPLDGGPAEAASFGEIMPTKGFARSRGRPGGERLAWSTCAERSELVTLTPAAQGRGGEARSLLGQTDWTDEYPAWIPGTQKLVVASDRTQTRALWVIDVSHAEAPRLLSLGGQRAVNAVVSRDGRIVVYASPADGLFAVPVDGSASPWRLTASSDDGSPCISVDGATVYYQTRGPDHRPRIAAIPLQREPPKPGAQLRASMVVRERAARPSLGARPNELVFLAAETTTAEGPPMVLDLASGAARELAPSTRGGRFAQVRLSPDGARAGLLAASMTEVMELGLARGVVRQRFDAGVDEIKDVAYLGEQLVLSRQVWSGGVWVAEDGP
jgi:serine/threonine protein kinase